MVYIKGSIFTIPRPKPLASIPFVPDVNTIRKFIEGDIGIADAVLQQMTKRQLQQLDSLKAIESKKLIKSFEEFSALYKSVEKISLPDLKNSLKDLEKQPPSPSRDYKIGEVSDKIKLKEGFEKKPGSTVTPDMKSLQTQLADLEKEFNGLKAQLLAKEIPSGVGLKSFEKSALQSLYSAEGPLVDIVMILLGMLKTIEDCICRVLMRQNPAKYWWSLNYQQIDLNIILDKLGSPFQSPRLKSLQDQVNALTQLTQNLTSSTVPEAKDLLKCALCDLKILKTELFKESCKIKEPFYKPDFINTIKGFLSDVSEDVTTSLNYETVYLGYFDNDGETAIAPEWITRSKKWIPGISSNPLLIDLEASDTRQRVKELLLKDIDLTPGTTSPLDSIIAENWNELTKRLDQSKLSKEEKERLCKCLLDKISDQTGLGGSEEEWEDHSSFDEVPEWKELQDSLLDITKVLGEAFPNEPSLIGPPITTTSEDGESEIMTDEEGTPIRQTDNITMLIDQMKSVAQIKKQIGLAILVHWAYTGRGNINAIWELLYGNEWKLRNAVPKSLAKLVNSFKKIEDKLVLVPFVIGKRLRKLWTKRFLKKLRSYLNASQRVISAANTIVSAAPRNYRSVNGTIIKTFSNKPIPVPPRISKGGFFPKDIDIAGLTQTLDPEGNYEIRVIRLEHDPNKYNFSYYQTLISSIKSIMVSSNDKVGLFKMAKGVAKGNTIFLYNSNDFPELYQSGVASKILSKNLLGNCLIANNQPYKTGFTKINEVVKIKVRTSSETLDLVIEMPITWEPLLLKEKIDNIVNESWTELDRDVWNVLQCSVNIPANAILEKGFSIEPFSLKDVISLDSLNPNVGIVQSIGTSGYTLNKSWGTTNWLPIALGEWFISRIAQNQTTIPTSINRTLWSVLKPNTGLIGSSLSDLSSEELQINLDAPITKVGEPRTDIDDDGNPQTLPDIEALTPVCLSQGLDPRYLLEMQPGAPNWDKYKAFWLIEAHLIKEEDPEGEEESDADYSGVFDPQMESFKGPKRGNPSPSRYKARHVITGYTKFVKEFLKTVFKKFFPTVQRLIEIIQDPRKIGELLGLIVQTRLRDNFVLFDTERMYNDIDISSNYTYFNKGLVQRYDNEVVSTIIDGIATVTIPGFFTIGFKIEKGLLTFIFRLIKKKCRFPSSIIQALLGLLMTPIKILISIIQEIIKFIKGVMKISSAVKTLKWFMTFKWLICILKPFNLLKLLGIKMDIPKLLSGRASSEGCLRQDPNYFPKSDGKGPCQKNADEGEAEFIRGMDTIGTMIEQLQELPEAALPWLNWDTLPKISEVGLDQICDRTLCILEEKYPVLLEEIRLAYSKPNGELDKIAIGLTAYQNGCGCETSDTLNLDQTIEAGLNLINQFCEPVVSDKTQICLRPETKKIVDQMTFRFGMILKKLLPEMQFDQNTVKQVFPKEFDKIKKESDELKKKKDKELEDKPKPQAGPDTKPKDGVTPGETSSVTLPNPIKDCVNVSEEGFLKMLELLGVKPGFKAKDIDLEGLKALLPSQFRRVELEDLANMSYATILAKSKPKLISLSDILSLPLFGQDLPKYTPEEMKELLFLPLEMIVGPLQLVEDTINGLIIFVWSVFGLNNVITPVPMLNIVCKIPKFEFAEPWDPLSKARPKIRRIPRCPNAGDYSLPKSSDDYSSASTWDLDKISNVSDLLGKLPDGILEGCGCSQELIDALKGVNLPQFQKLSNGIWSPYNDIERILEEPDPNIPLDDDERGEYNPKEDSQNPY